MAERMFPDVPSDLDFLRDERKTFEFWRQEKIFQKTLEHRAGAPTFVFYEGPPTANGMPHNGHVLTRVMKDIFPRYKTMRGFRVPRKAGWDTHGLPVEVEVEKELHIHGKAAIEEYGIEPFTARCIDSVFRYTREWERFSDRIAFWIDNQDAYVTYHRPYVESVWWALAELHKKGLLYRGHKVVWWWAQGGTALSSAEVGQGYKTVDDPSLFVAFTLRDPVPGLEGEVALAVWTTTPWTLPSNMYAAVKVEAVYVAIEAQGRRYLAAQALAPELAKKLKGHVVEGFSCEGADLVGKRYTPPFDTYFKDHADERTAAGEAKYWRVLGEDFVTLTTGTGIVHIAPAFGEDDNRAFQRLGRLFGEPLELFCAVRPDGTFGPEAGEYAGRWVKDCDKDIQQQLRREGKVLLTEQIKHEYPFCWRASSDPLIQYARPAWYIRTTSKLDRALANNQAIQWLPDHIKEGRFGDFLRNNVDWALSRERYWGTPLPLWENASLPDEHPERFVAFGSLDELRAQPGSNVAEVEAMVAAAIPDPERARHLLVHKPWVDRITFTRPGVEGTYRRVPEVIDCWFDSGCMPFAQWGFPHAAGSHEKLREAFPADFICEAIDQTRGWFYTLLMVSTLVFDAENQQKFGLAAGENLPHPYKTCIVLGHVTDKEGKKESKSVGNYTPPDVIMDRVGMDFVVADVRDVKAKLEKVKIELAPGQVAIAAEDYEGLDLGEASAGKAVDARLHRADRADDLRAFKLLPVKDLPRRVVVLHPDDIQAFGLTLAAEPLRTKPSDVPFLPPGARLYVEDPHAPPPGADAFRWFFYANSPPWTNTRHSLANVRAAQKDFLIKLRNVYSFFTIYANIDQWTPALAAPPVAQRPLLCRWALSELALTTQQVTDALDRFLVFDAAQRLGAFVEALSNWFVRRSREQFWASGVGDAMGDDKRAVYATLYTCLTTLAKLIAPFTPYLAEELHQGLVIAAGTKGAQRSVHLEDYPQAEEAWIDRALSDEMAAVRELVSLGLQVRNASKVKVRQPLGRLDIVPSRPELRGQIAPHLGLLREELNVKEVTLLDPGAEGQEVRYRLKPNFKVLGPKVGKRVQRVKQLLEQADAGALRSALAGGGQATLDVDGEPLLLSAEDLEVAVEAAPGFAAAGGRSGVVILHTTVSDELRREGVARELQSRLQAWRKERKLPFEARLARVTVRSPSEQVRAAASTFADELRANVLIDALAVEAGEGGAFADEVEGERVWFDVTTP